MPDLSTPDFIDFEIVIQHDEPVRLLLVQEVFNSAAHAALGANLGDVERLAGVILQLPIPQSAASQFYALARTQIEAEVDRLVWLQSVESGSSKFKGKIVRLGRSLVVFIVGTMAGDLLDRQPWYRELVDAIENGRRHVIERIVEDINRGFPNHDGPPIEAEIVGDRIRIVVHPRRRDGDMTFSPIPPSH